MKKASKYIEQAPDGKSIRELVRYIIDHGIGKELDLDGLPQVWNKQDLADRADLSLGTLDSWLEGKHFPRPESARKLAKLISNGDLDVHRSWVKAFLKHKASRLGARDSISKPDIAAQDRIVGSASSTRRERARVPTYFFLAGACLTIMALLLAIDRNQSKKSGIEIGNLKVCEESDFSRMNLKCAQESTKLVFSKNSRKLYVSFETQGATPGEKFTRNWYHNGELFFSKDGYFDDVWEGWTYIGHRLLRGEGEYAMRIVVGDKAIAHTKFYLE